MGFHPRLYNRWRKRLMDVIHCADFETAGFVFDFCLRGKENDGYVSRLRIHLQTRADFVPVHAGHHHIEQDEVGWRSNLHEF